MADGEPVTGGAGGGTGWAAPRAFTGLWVPRELWLHPGLTLEAKVMAAEVHALDDPDRGCTARNEYFCGFFGWSVSRVKQLLQGLEAEGIIEREVTGAGERVIRSRLPEYVVARRMEEQAARAAAAAGAELGGHGELGGHVVAPSHELGGQFTGHPPANILAPPPVDTLAKESKDTEDHTLRCGLSRVRPVGRGAPVAPSGAEPADPAPPRRGRPPVGGAADYEAIYRAYPRRIERKAALTAIAAAVRRVADEAARGARALPAGETPAGWMLARVAAYAAHRAAAVAADPAEAEFTPYPQKWFNRGRYDDEAPPPGAGGRAPRRVNGGGTNGHAGAAGPREGQYAEPRRGLAVSRFGAYNVGGNGPAGPG